MKIRTAQDYEKVASCAGCPFPGCEEPRCECESLTGVASPVGWKDPDDTVWNIYAIKTVATSYALSTSTEGFREGYGNFVSTEHTVAATSTLTSTFDRLFSGQIAGGGDCGVWTATVTPVCTATGSETTISRSVLSASLNEEDPGDLSYELVVDATTSTSVEEISGQETPEHIAWETESADWDAANPDHEADVAAWQTAHDDWQVAHDAWEADYLAWVDAWNAWNAGGQVGPEPEEPGPEPEEPVRPPDRPTEPEENYPPCSWKKVTTTTTNHWAFYSYSAEDPGLVNEGIDVETSEEFFVGTLPTWAGESAVATSYSGGQDRDAWVAATSAVFDAAMDFPKPGCTDTLCESSKDTGPPPPPDPEPVEGEDPPPPVPGPDPSLTLTKARYRLGIPAAWADYEGRHAAWVTAHAAWAAADPETRGAEPVEPGKRSYYQVQEDQGFFAKAWDEWDEATQAFLDATAAHEAWQIADPTTRGDEPEIPDEPGPEPLPKPSKIGSIDWEWTFGEDEFSGWSVIPLPTGAGQNRRVNQLVKCFRWARVGTKPWSFGETYPFADE